MNWNLVVIYVSPIVALFITFVLNKYFQNKSKIIAYFSHVGAHKVSTLNGPLDIYTHTLVIRNVGKKTATNVKLGHNILPDFSTYPSVQYHLEDLPKGGQELNFPKIVPNEQITISYIYFPPVDVTKTNTYIKSDDGMAKVINVLPTEELKTWKKIILFILLFIGLSFSIYLTIKLIAFIAIRVI